MDRHNQKQALEDSYAKTSKPGLRGVFEACADLSGGDRRVGVLRLFRNKEQEAEAEAVSTAFAVSKDLEASAESTPVLGVVGVPGYMTPTDFISFAGVLRDSIEHMRVIADARSANHYMVLLRFRSGAQAEKFNGMFNGKTFSPLEPETCNVVFIGLAECDAMDIQQAGDDGGRRVFVRAADVFVSAEGTSCAVCLEPLDDGTAGLLTILCQHSFHAQCLARWGDGTCPVCRHSQTAPFVDHEQFERTVASQTAGNPAEGGVSRCHACERTDDLWICLICGSIGCGRYANAHAKDHFARTDHPYSMKLESQVVWDYVGDGYVHRLLQGMGDGKLVAMETPARPASAAAVMETSPGARSKQDEPGFLSEDALLLAAQLESQKEHYEAQLAELSRRHTQDMKQLSESDADKKSFQKQVDSLLRLGKQLKEQADAASEENKQLCEAIERERKAFAAEKSRLEASLAQWIKKSNKDATLLKEEKAMAGHLLENQEDLKAQISSMHEQIRDLTEQIRDLSFFISTQQAINADDGGSAGQSEIQGASIVGVAQPPVAGNTKTKGKRRIPRK
ncbi:hypothetical protein H4R99_004883 [Coemansia sp. RSA 1722]|nr:hypothetical protein LPJ57_005259 [Coemansia sp. RSA 486]KAJ2596539.1 hypothetical protein H4R99_004883 [Coemansia sp. RSA 1722]KAJ2636989.1 hypothetical protein GGF40_002667 [Coemansia sp. RSA 1286]